MDTAISKRPGFLSPPHVVNVSDLRRMARKRLPRAVFDYVDGAAEDESTYRANVSAFDLVQFRPRMAVSLPDVNLRTHVLGSDLQLPFALAPVGSSRMFWPKGEAQAAAAAGAAGTAYS